MITHEHRTALAASAAALTAAALAATAGAGWGPLLTLALIGYGTVLGAVVATSALRLGTVLRVTSHGLVLAAVVTALVLISTARSVAALTGVNTSWAA
ncbi:hypothetical protein [Streptomyces nanshensis]|uniref:Uncharacterized protein n=1 Tax=Streptomyces nanshensis TaxID=518642 RepID=A0A1E7LA38_9ACTN|nr:hypothetical protein [Streptomyces nanshensis]OEV13018.1 hypothetical protein AN218_05795 [Streptomyces nanshensis]